MKFSTIFASVAGLAVASTGALAQANASVCDKYSMALFNSTNSTVQMQLLTALVNTALIGNLNLTGLGGKNEVSGILNNGTYNGTQVSLIKYFDGSLKSTNEGGSASAVNFLDGGGAAPLKELKAATDDSSRQYTLLTHLYQYFGQALKCSSQSANGEFKTYQGDTSMSKVHRFMNLNYIENSYFIQEVGKAATSFGVTAEDATAVGNTLNMLFNYRCSPAISFPSGANASQSICLASSCPLADKYNCTIINNVSYPNGTNGTAAALASGGMAPEDPTNSAASSLAASQSKTRTAAAAGSTGSTTGGGSTQNAAPALGFTAFQSAMVFASLGLGAIGVLVLV
ncbi:unnamed protein product [Parajaminaea phylloscopi]